MLKEITIPIMPVLVEDLGMQYATELSTKKRRYGVYKCSCGKEFKAVTPNIKNGHTNSCGCFKKQQIINSHIIHGMRKHPIYNTWSHILSRCTNTNNSRFKDYGGRGITVCDRWRYSFENFRDDMFPTWEEGLTIDRINNDGNYEPSNCRWVNSTIQNRNQRIIMVTNTTGYRGVSIVSKNNKFMSGIRVSGKSIYLGYFNTALEAAKVYDKYVLDNNLEHTINGVL